MVHNSRVHRPGTLADVRVLSPAHRGAHARALSHHSHRMDGVASLEKGPGRITSLLRHVSTRSDSLGSGGCANRGSKPTCAVAPWFLGDSVVEVMSGVVSFKLVLLGMCYMLTGRRVFCGQVEVCHPNSRSIALRFVKDQFDDFRESTIGGTCTHSCSGVPHTNRKARRRCHGQT